MMVCFRKYFVNITLFIVALFVSLVFQATKDVAKAEDMLKLEQIIENEIKNLLEQELKCDPILY